MDGMHIIRCIYSAKVKSKSKSFKTSVVYLPVKFTSVIKYADGTLYVDTDSDSIEGESGLNYSDEAVDGLK